MTGTHNLEALARHIAAFIFVVAVHLSPGQGSTPVFDLRYPDGSWTALGDARLDSFGRACTSPELAQAQALYSGRAGATIQLLPMGLIAGFALFLVANQADFQLQAEAHGWGGLLWERNARAPKWPGILDAIPHDGYHLALWLSHIGLIGGSVLTWDSVAGAAWYMCLGSIFLSYTVARGLGFSLPRKILQGY